jgi:MerR, DNA binding
VRGWNQFVRNSLHVLKEAHVLTGMLVMVGLAPDGVRGAPHRARQFPEDATRLFRFIRHAQELGFSLPEIGELLALRVSRTSTS